MLYLSYPHIIVFAARESTVAARSPRSRKCCRKSQLREMEAGMRRRYARFRWQVALKCAPQYRSPEAELVCQRQFSAPNLHATLVLEPHAAGFLDRRPQF